MLAVSAQSPRVRRCLCATAMASMLLAFALPAAADARSDRYRVRDVTAISGRDPFRGQDCGLDVPPPLGPSTFLPKDTAIEPHAAVNPRDPDNIVATWIQDFSKGHIVAFTKNGGKTWHRSTPPGLSDCSGAESGSGSFDPYLNFSSDGTVYLSSMTGTVDFGATAPSNVVNVNRSENGGRSWSVPTRAEPRKDYNDHPSVIVDPNNPSRVLVAWADHSGPFGSNTDALKISDSPDAGRSWSAPRVVYVPPAQHFAAGTTLTALKNGTLLWTYGVFDSVSTVLPLPKEPREMQSLRSTDGGRTWSGPAAMGFQDRNFAVEDEEQDMEIERDGWPSVAALSEGGAAAVWSDQDQDGRGKILMTRSTSGRAWSRPVVAVKSPKAAFLPTLAESGEGRLGLTWFDLRRDEPGDDELTTEVRFASSRDRGRTWSKPRHLAGPFDVRTAWHDPRTPPSPVLNLGDFMGMTGLPHGFMPIFIMARPEARVGQSQAFAAPVVRRR